MCTEDKLLERLAYLPEAQRRAFSAAVATRQVVSLERVAEKRFNVADRLWQGIGGNESKRELWSRRIASLPRLVPGCDAVRPCSQFVSQAMASLGYAMLCRLSGSSRDAAKAAVCAINAAGLAERHLESIKSDRDLSNPLAEGGTLAAREALHQEDDLEFLSLGWLDEIRWKSYANPMLTQREAALLSGVS